MQVLTKILNRDPQEPFPSRNLCKIGAMIWGASITKERTAVFAFEFPIIVKRASILRNLHVSVKLDRADNHKEKVCWTLSV